MAAKLVVGDVVKLRSDGPWLTVVKDRLEQGPKFVQASWFDGSTLKSEVFPREALVAKDTGEGAPKGAKPAAADAE